MHDMGDPRNAPALLHAGGTHQSACCHKEHVFVISRQHLRQDKSGKDAGAASAARAAGVHILPPPVVNEKPAVIVNPAHIIALGGKQVCDDTVTLIAEIAADDQVVILRLRAAFPEIPEETVHRGGRHGGAHVVQILNAAVHTPAGHHVGDPYMGGFVSRFAAFGEQKRPCARHRPLRGGGTLRAVLQRKAELPLGGRVVRGHHDADPPVDPALQKHGSEAQSLRRGGAGAVNAK